MPITYKAQPGKGNKVMKRTFFNVFGLDQQARWEGLNGLRNLVLLNGLQNLSLVFCLMSLNAYERHSKIVLK